MSNSQWPGHCESRFNRQLISAVVSAATVSTVTAATTTPTAATTAFLTRSGFVHSQIATVKVGAVETVDCFVCIVLAHFHKSKSFGSASVAIRNQCYRFNGASL